MSAEAQAAEFEDDAALKETQQNAADDQLAMEELTEASRVLQTLREHTETLMADHEPVRASTVAAIRTSANVALSRISDLPLPAMAMESMDADSLGVTLEAITEKLKQIWEAIKAALAKFFTSIANLFKTTGEKAGKAAEATKQTIQQLEAVPAAAPAPEPEKVNKPNILRHFTVGNKVPADFLTQCKAALEGLKWVFVDNNATEEHLEKLSRVIAGRPVDKLNDPDLAADIVTFFSGVAKRYQAIKGGGNANVPAESAGDPQLATGLLPGDVAISARYPGDSQSLTNAMASCSVQVWHRQGKVDNLVAPANLTREQLADALKSCEEFLSSMASFGQGSVPRIEALSKAILTSGEQLVSRGTPETEGTLKTTVSILNGYVHHVLQIRQVAMSYGYALCGSLNALAKEYAVNTSASA